MSCRIILKRAICSLSITPRFCLPPDGHQRCPQALSASCCCSARSRAIPGSAWPPRQADAAGHKVEFGDGSLTAVVDETLPDGNKYVTFTYDTETLYEKLDEFGKMPLPPYITKQLEDQSQYQTVYAKRTGQRRAPPRACTLPPQLMDTIRSPAASTLPRSRCMSAWAPSVP